MITLLYVLAVILGIMLLEDFILFAVFFELLHGHGAKAILIFVMWLFID